MEPNGLGGGIFPSMSSGMLGVDNSSQQQNISNHPNHHHLHTNPQMVSYTGHHDKHGYPFSSKSTAALSDEEEPGFAADDSSGDPKGKNTSPWQRMKWTDTMVRLLIMAVYYIGDEGVSEGTDPSNKKKASGLLQKKGKWKSVSRGMMEKGFYVSPQQCEDKFNDLNKRYKRVNDILGRGTACRVVENQSLLDTMDLSPKMKEEARKLLNSKHLFFREMCAYHNSCGHGGGPQPETAAAPLRQQCSHTTEDGVRVGGMEEDSEFESESESEGFSEEEEEEWVEQEEENVERKRKRKQSPSASAEMQRVRGEVAAVMEEGGKSEREKKEWMKRREMEMEEEGVRCKMRGFDLEKQRLKWARFSSKKERDMERAMLENERRKLETERMLLMIRHKEIDLLALHHQHHHHSSN